MLVNLSKFGAEIWCWDVDQMLYFTLEEHKKG